MCYNINYLKFVQKSGAVIYFAIRLIIVYKIMEYIKKYFGWNTVLETLLLVIMIVVSGFICFKQSFDHDEFEAIHTAWKLLKGQIIYIDFFQQKPPFFHLTMIPLIKIFGDSIKTIFACKIYCYVLFLGIIFTSCLISKYVFKSKTVMLTAVMILSCTFFTDKLTEVRPDTLYIFLIMISFVFLYKNIKIKRSSLLMSAFFAGLSFAVLPKAVFHIIIIGAILFFRFVLKKISLKDIFLYFLTMFLAVVPFFIYFFSKSISIEDYWFFNFTVNYNLLMAFSPLTNMKLLLGNNIFLFVFALIGLFLLKGYRQKEIGFAALMLFLSVLLIKVPNKQYYVTSIPFVAMIASNAIKKVRIFNKAEFLILIFLLLYPVKYFYGQINSADVMYKLERIKFVLDNTQCYDKVYDGSIDFNIFRDDVDYFWFSIRPSGAAESYRKLRPREYDIYSIIEEQKPKIIYTKRLSFINEYIINHYNKTQYHGILIRNENA